ncbi:TIGR03560 family F420-dependent LLM class oxidoreductase [Thermomicrobium sp. CFH 73360]|uniref:TIGR03560 family F420-dependent LLM class oxidoreductase n=1 Tax=Thermomicrobium sp. CFH 73360 TaxID=2951987 RepID=UPI0020774638|nr:TIGR03560 family F420-dependent LLM class oxidoreductase [Thermomicrobium sp. CFH 73360]MCM8747213.1 TIGR03560 family F420-dependent LLM class oxidoreductase [Thermomicrobium sp. CFH 73360]
MRIGIMVEGQEDVTWERWFRVVALTEELGFDSLWRSDHLFSVIGVVERETLALWPSLTAVALRTTRITFGQLVSPVSFRHPVELAQHAVALDHLSGGRYVLGVGAGWYEREHEAFGFALLSVRERMERLAEALEVIRLLWTGEVVSHQGTYYQLVQAQLRPRPLREAGLPIVIGGRGERRTLPLAARYAAEWNVTNVGVEEHARKVALLHEHCRAIGRDPETVVCSWMVAHLIGRDGSELEERAHRLRRWFPFWSTLSPAEVIAEAKRRHWLVGTPEEVLEQIRARAAIGVRRLMLQTFDLDDVDALRLIATEIVPAVAQ